MKTLYLECKMGISGDMFFGALLDLIPEPEKWMENFNSIGIPNVHAHYEKKSKCGIYGTHVSVFANGIEEESTDVSLHHEHTHEHEHHHHHEHTHDHDHHHHHDHTHEHGHHHHHDHTHEHGHHHHHATLAHIESVIDSLHVSKQVKKDAKAVYTLLAQAEASVHNTTIQDIHFHEVGTLDAIADIVGGCMLIESLHPDKIIASPVHVGNGHVHCAHGILPVPAPATAALLEKVPFYSGEIQGELCTPTGAALLSYFADSYGPMPALMSAKTGYGLGTKDFAAANMVRAFLGDSWKVSGDFMPATVVSSNPSANPSLHGVPHITELRCTLDDMTPEAIGFVQSLLLENGALDVLIMPVQMKKNRPGHILCVSCKDEDETKMTELLFQHTTTAGIRKLCYERCTLDYDFTTVSTPYGEISIKHYFGYGADKYKPEYKDVAKASMEHQVSFQAVWQAALKASNHLN